MTILFFLLITIVMGAGIPKLGFNNSIESFMPHRDKEYLLYNKIKDTYGNPDNFHIFSVTHPRLWSTEAFAKLNELLVDIEAYQDFDEKLENRRLETLNTVISKGPVSPYVLIDQFNHDPVFKKLLSRKIESMFKSKKMLSERNLNKLKDKIKLSYDLKKNESVDTIISPFTIKDITGKNDVLEIFDLIEFDENGKRVLPQTERELSEFRKRLMRNPAFDKGIYSKHPETGEITDFGVIVMFKNMADYDPIEREMCELAKSYDTLTITSFGAPYVVMVNNDYVQRDLIMLLPLVLITVILVFYYNFKSVRGVILPFSAICMTIIWTLGLIGHLGFKLTLLGNIIPSLMVAVGSSYSIHIINQYYADFDLITRKGLREGLRISMGHISVTVLLAGLTTCIAFITLTSSQISAVKEWGFFSAVGVLSAVFISVSLIPAILSLMIHKRPQRLLNKSNALKTTISDRILYIFTIGATRHYKKVLSVLSILILISFVGIFYLNVETQFMMNFRENSEIRTNEKIISKKFGGGNNFSILVDTGKENGVLTPDFLNTIENFRAWLVLDENIDLNIGRTDA
ncbi:MAG: MMPL family transporter, partial [Bacteroidota bacterium]